MKSSGRIIAIIFSCLLVAAAAVTAVILMGQKDSAAESGNTYQTEEQTEITVSAETEGTTEPLASVTSTAATTTRPPETEKTEKAAANSSESVSQESLVKDSVSGESLPKTIEQQTVEISFEALGTAPISDITRDILETKAPASEENTDAQDSFSRETAPEFTSVETFPSTAGLPVVSDVMY